MRNFMLRQLLITVLLVQPVLAQDRVTRFDTNGDKKVDSTELTRTCEISKRLFERADKNGDGYLSNGEMKTAKGYLFTACKEESSN